jgi:inorganic pyrophosphatase
MDILSSLTAPGYKSSPKRRRCLQVLPIGPTLVSQRYLREQVTKAFIECEAGSKTKHRYDEDRLTLRESFELNTAYPYAYGFLQGLRTAEGDCLDCFLITPRPARSGELLECDALGMIEVFEGDEVDNKVVVTRWGEDAVFGGEEDRRIKAFILNIFKAFPDVAVCFGRVYNHSETEAYLSSFEASHEGTGKS